eukprot:Gb_10303 [translate_table: standard]
MEARKRMEYGFQGYQPPPLPRAMRSARGRAEGSQKKKSCIGNGRVFFELLATVAGELLQEKEIEKNAPELEGIIDSGMTNERIDNEKGEGQDSPEQALLDLHNSECPSGSINAGELTVADADQRLGFKDLVYKGSFNENAKVTSEVQRKLIFDDPPMKKESDVIPQNVSRSTSIISRSDCPGQFPGKKFIDNQVTHQQKICMSSGEGQGSTGSHGKEKGNSHTDACEEEIFLPEQSLVTTVQEIAESGGMLANESMGTCENREGRGENDVDEINSGRWQRVQSASGNIEDEAVADAHALLVSSESNEKLPLCMAVNPPLLVDSGSSGKAPQCVKSTPCDSFIDGLKDRVNVYRDDDGNSSDSTDPSTITNKSFKSLYMKGAKLRRAIRPRLRRAVSAFSNKRKLAEMDIVSNTDGIVKSETPRNRVGSTWQRAVRYPSSKRKKLAEGIPTSDATDLDLSGVDIELHSSHANLCSAKSASLASSSRSAAGGSKHSSKKSVKLSIKSFTVPELCIDVPESATVANLKRAAMEAVVNLLGGGLRVQVLLQGKKVTDESATLVQVGISHADKLDAVGILLEPNSVPTSSTGAEDPHFVFSYAATQPPSRTIKAGRLFNSDSEEKAELQIYSVLDKPYLSPAVENLHEFPLGFFLKRSLVMGPTTERYPMVSCSGAHKDFEGKRSFMRDCSSKKGTIVADSVPNAAGQMQTNINQWVKIESETVGSLLHTQRGLNSGALVVHPGIGGDNGQGLALVPLRHRSRGTEIGKRRLRRPFTVAEVEVLVQAVEKHGTGRWREIKLCAFDHAKHRTYVDLKDKWKTLVHTARIAPHQRRGEPVPLELLDRVIRAHSYWTKQQSNQEAEL